MEDVSLPILVVRVVVSLSVVLGLMAAAAAVLRRSGVGGAGLTGGRGRRLSAKRVEVLSRHGLGRNSSVTVLRLGDRALVLGVTETSVTLLAETDPSNLEPPPPDPGDDFAPAANPWSTLIDALRERTVRRS